MANIVSRANLMGDPLHYFPNFLWKVWQTIGLGSPNAIEYDFAEYLAAPAPTEGARRILMGFRGGAKSYVTTTFAVQLLYVDPNELVLAVSATSRYAGAISNFAWQMISNFDWLAARKPSPSQRRSSLAFDVAGIAEAQKDESFVSESIFGQVTGHRATRILGDDLETPNTSETEGKRAELRSRMAELGGAIIKPGGSIYLLGTAQTEDTVYREYHEEKGYELRMWPIEYPLLSEDPKKDELRKYGPLLAPLIASKIAENPHLSGTSTMPERFSEADIMQRRREWGNVEFDRQFKLFLDAGVGLGNPLKMRDLIIMELGSGPQEGVEFLLPSEVRFAATPDCRLEGIEVDALTGDSQLYGPSKVDFWVKPEVRVCVVDPSGTGEDETTWSIGAELLGMVFLLWQGASVEGHTDDTLNAIAKDCKRWGVQVIKVESNFGQEMFGQLLQPACAEIGYYPEIINEPAPQQQKEVRIVNDLEPVLSTHRAVVNAEVLRQDFHVEYPHVEAGKRRYYRLTYQLSRMTKAKGAVKHDDRVEGFSGLCHHFGELLVRRKSDAAKEGKVRAIEAEGQKMIDLRREQGLPLYGLEKQDRHFGKASRKPFKPGKGQKQ